MKLDIKYKIEKYLAITKLLLKKSEAYVILNGNKIFFNNFNSIGILEKNIHEIDQSRIFIYKKINVFFDIGAHIGVKSLILNSVNPKCRILAFEPNSITFNFLKKNTSHINNIMLFPVALGNKEGEVNIFYDTQHLDTASLNSKSYYLLRNTKRSIKNENVPIKKLDNFIKYINNNDQIFLKIDVETLEKDVLNGGKKILSRVKYLEIEITQDKNQKFSEIINLINRDFNIIDIDIFKADSYLPKLINILIELY